MNTTLLVLLIPLLSIPLLIWLRQKTYNRRKDYVSAQCKSCGTYNTLEKLRNYECKQCNQLNAFFDDSGQKLPEIEVYLCAYCEEENFKGILTCSACGLVNQAGIPSFE